MLTYLWFLICVSPLFCVESFNLNRPRLHHGIAVSSVTSPPTLSAFKSNNLMDTRFPTSDVSTTSLQAAPLDIMVSMYKDSLMDNPLETKLLTGGVLAFLGDAIAQSQAAIYDKKRAAAFVTFDIVYRAVQCALFPSITTYCDGHYLASLLSTVSVPAEFIDIHSLATMEQTFANQFIVIPLIYYPVFFSLTGYLQGLSMEATVERVETTLVPLLKRNWLFWIPVQYFQFGYVDEPLQIPFLCVAGLAWTFILSTVAGSIETYGDDAVVEEEAMTSASSVSSVEGVKV
jgi:protein Mpv17